MMVQFARSNEIQRRLDALLLMIGSGKYSTPELAERTGVSIATVSRCVQALRERGHTIRAERLGNRWRYVLVAKFRRGSQRNAATETAFTQHE